MKSTTTTTAERILQRLRHEPARGPALSIYLDTSPARMERQAHRLSLVSGVQRVRETVPPAEHRAFEAAVKRVERYLDSEHTPTRRGIAMFVVGDADELLVAELPRAPIDRVFWGPAAHVEPLQVQIEEHERIAVVLTDKERARIFTICLGEIEEHRTIHDDVPGKHASGDWFALAQSRIARHHDVQVRRHIEHAIATLLELLETRPFDRLIIGGPDEAVAALREYLPGPLRARLAGSIRLELFARDAEVLEAALRAAETAERRAELAEIDELLEATSSRYVVLGVDDTLAALSDGRVFILYVADAFAGTAGECESCGLLIAYGAQCPRCEAPLRMVRDLRERVVERALDQAARVEVVSGDAATALLRHGGIGAWTRY